MVCCGSSVSRAQKTWLWSLSLCLWLGNESLSSLTTLPNKASLPSHKQRLVTKPNSTVGFIFNFASFYRFVMDTNSRFTSLAGLQLRGCKFPFRKRSLPFETVVAISQNGRYHLKRSIPFITVDYTLHFKEN